MSTTHLVFVGLVATGVAALAGWLSLRADRLAARPPVVGRSGRRRRRPLPTTGTVLAVATTAAALGVRLPDGRAFALLAVALALGGVGLVAERQKLRPSARVGAEAVAALAAVALGLRTGLTGLTVANLALVVLFVVVAVEAFRLFDVAPRAAAALGAPAAATLGVVAAEAGQDGLASLGLALAGGLVGLSVGGTRQRFVLGESGALLAGFLLATLVVAVDPATAPPMSMAVVLPVVALPLVNAAVVVAYRLRRGRPLTSRRPDGIPHRLRAIPLPWGVALAILAGSQAAVGAVVVLADRSTVPWVAPPLVAGVVVIALLARARRRVHHSSTPRLPPPVRWAGLAVAGVAAVLVVPAALVLLMVRGLVLDGAAAAERGLAAARAGQVEASGAAFDQAETALVEASGRLDHPLASLGLVVPVLGPNLAAARTVSALGAELAATGAEVTTAAPENLTVSAGVVPIDELRRLAPDLAEAAADLARARTVAAGIERAYVLPALRQELSDFDARLERAALEADVAAQAASVVPAILGADGPRNYFLAIQNNAELRATGGFLGNYGELVAEAGSLRLEELGRHQDLNEAGPEEKVVNAPDDYLERYSPFQVASTWESVNLSPDFPTVASVIAGMYPQSGGRPVDGAIAVDPVGLSALLRLTGPVAVDGWPEAITAENVVEVTLNEAYVAFEDQLEERIDFLGTVAAASVDALRNTNLGSPSQIVAALGPAARGGHLSLWFADPDEQALVDRLGVAGRVEPVEGDSLLVVNQNVGANKLDYYLRRTTSYDVALRPDGDQMAVEGRLRVELHNQAPDEGLPRYVIGPFDERFEPGENATFLSLYTPLTLTDATWDGEPQELAAAEELGRRVYSWFFSVPARSTRTFEARVTGTVEAQPGGWYELNVLHQPVLFSDPVSVSVEVPEGWRIAEAEGARLEGDGRAVAAVAAEQDETVRLRLERR